MGGRVPAPAFSGGSLEPTFFPMHYKDGTPAKLGDIVKHDSGAVGIVIGGTIGSDYCSTQVVKFTPANLPCNNGAPGFVGALKDSTGKVEAVAGVAVTLDSCMQTRECVKIAHVDIGHG